MMYVRQKERDEREDIEDQAHEALEQVKHEARDA